ncbi:hypothetical protein Tco_0591568 [Tanacetum coccineum]
MPWCQRKDAEGKQTAVPMASITVFCEVNYDEDILPDHYGQGAVMTSKEVQTRPDFWRESTRKTPKRKGESMNSRAEHSPIRFHHERSVSWWDRATMTGNVVFNLLSHRKKSGPSPESDEGPPPWSRKKSYADSYSSHGTGTMYRDRSRDRDHFVACGRDGGKVNPYHLADQKATPVTEDTRSQERKRASQQMKKTWSYPGLASM